MRAQWTAAEREVATEFIAHGRAIRAEREAARRESRAARLANLIDSWGGITIAYRRRLIDSPSYTLNHEEVAKATEEGIRFAELLTPVEVEVDVFGQAAALRLTRQPAEPEGAPEEVRMPARTILVAGGRNPTRCWAARIPRMSSSTGVISARSTKKGTRPPPNGRRSPRRCEC